MNKAELSAALAVKMASPKSFALKVVEHIFADDGIIAQTLKSGEKVNITDFGVFTVRERKPRIGINPKTKAKIQIPAKRSVRFKGGKGLKAMVAI
jgi:DNA-binding protein HU-beta